MATTPETPQWMSRHEAARVLGVDVAVVDRLISSGALDRYRLRGRYIRLKGSQVVDLAALPAEWLARA